MPKRDGAPVFPGVKGFAWTIPVDDLQTCSVQPISQKADASGGRKAIGCFFLIFLLMGGGFFYGFFLRPVIRMMAARGWVETPCVIESSEVKSHRGDNGTTYSVAIQYRYLFEGRTYRSERYQFMTGSSSGRKGKEAVVRHYPPGQSAVCYVNPQAPDEAVIERGWTPDLWFGLIPLVFVVVGLVGVIFGFKSRPATPRSMTARAARRRMSSAAATGLESDEGASGPVVLKARQSPMTKLILVTLFALFWNGIVSVFVVQVIRGWQSSRGGFMEKWFLPVFLIPFVLIGLGLIFAIGYCFLALFNPRPRLTINARSLALGETLELEWLMEGRVHVLRRVKIFLEGREEATYRRGTSTYTDRNVFARLPIAETAMHNDMRAGRAKFVIPSDTVPTFQASNNKIIWAVKVRGEIDHWPDLDEELPINLRPGRSAPPVESPVS